jgi:hypothetical protein
MNKIDFSNNSDALIQNMDSADDGDVRDNFQSYSGEAMKDFLESFVLPILPDEFFTSGGLTINEYLDRFAFHCTAAAKEDNQYFKGFWKSSREQTKGEREISLSLEAMKDAVHGKVYDPGGMTDGWVIDHLHMVGTHIRFTYRTKGRAMIEVDAIIQDDQMKANFSGIEDPLGSYLLIRKQK